jgi:hypothetical protein
MNLNKRVYVRFKTFNKSIEIKDHHRHHDLALFLMIFSTNNFIF